MHPTWRAVTHARAVLDVETVLDRPTRPLRPGLFAKYLMGSKLCASSLLVFVSLALQLGLPLLRDQRGVLLVPKGRLDHVACGCQLAGMHGGLVKGGHVDRATCSRRQGQAAGMHWEAATEAASVI